MYPKFQVFQIPESKAASHYKLFGFYNGEGGFGDKKILKKYQFTFHIAGDCIYASMIITSPSPEPGWAPSTRG
jgi:hypothetical protein